jgi:hypothetical protein
MERTIKITKYLIFISFTLPVIWYLMLEYYLLPEMHKADYDVGIAFVFLYGSCFVFIVMAVFELVGSSILGWQLIKNNKHRTKTNIMVLIIGCSGSFIAVLVPSYFWFAS